ncbi:MAG: reverse transcriptase family protein [Kangiellaceae bacterium]|nr:reverse transcriptase family protein [Kangiellaceae bacterium]
MNLVIPNSHFVFNNDVPIPEFTIDDVVNVLKDLDVNKASPPSDISPFLLKNCRSVLASQLTFIFNRSVSSGTVPLQWKKANVVPIHKKGKRADVSNYRPVSLLPCASKVLERCLFNHLYSFIKRVLYNMQHGFMKNRSSTTQLLKCYDLIGRILDEGGQVDVIYLDFSKAFDSVSHSLFLFKLEHFYGISGSLLDWFKDYLSNRVQRVVVEGEESDWTPVTSGVPQGSILGPFLFLLFINDMPRSVSSAFTALFADDCKIFMPINSNRDSVLLQSDLNELLKWSTNWGMAFNPSKCKVLTITRSHSPVSFNYHLDGNVLERVCEFRDLGVVFNKNLSFTPHIECIVLKANRVSGIIKRTVGYSAPQYVKLRLFTTLVRPILENCSQVWSPSFKKDIYFIESTQRSMTKYVLNIFTDEMSYCHRLQALHILPLSYRREVADLMFVFKYLKGFINVDFTDEVSILNNTRTLRSSNTGLLLQNRIVRTETFKASFFFFKSHLSSMEYFTCFY